MSKYVRIFVAVLTLLNAVVLLGQVWPEGAPPFARTVNVAFLVLSLAFFVGLLSGKLATRAE